MNPNPNPLFAVVDVETTGGKPIDSRITEIGIVISDGQKIIEEYTALINPKRKIDWYVTKLTGITNEMVAEAPTFIELSDRIQQLLENKIFVAHNADFDYGIVKREFLEMGRPLTSQKLCTVQATKKVIQHMSSYSLGNLCQQLDIPLVNAHRALDDARATTMLLHKVLEKADLEFLQSELRYQNKIVQLPSHWEVRGGLELNSIPSLIYFHNQEGEIIYIEFAKDPQRKLYSILEKAEKNDYSYKRVVEHTKSITIDVQRDEFKGEMKMLNDIQVLLPRYNKPFKMQNELFAMYLSKDESGLYYIAISRSKSIEDMEVCPVIYCASFKSAEKLKNKFNHSAEIAKLMVLKKQIYSAEINRMDGLVKIYNDTILEKLYKEYCAPMKSGYYLFDINENNEAELIQVKNHYLYAWGQGTFDAGQITSFRTEFIFDKNQKMTRKFLNILPKTSYKLIYEDE